MTAKLSLFLCLNQIFFFLGDRFPAFAISEIFIYGLANVTDEVWYWFITDLLLQIFDPFKCKTFLNVKNKSSIWDTNSKTEFKKKKKSSKAVQPVWHSP